MYLMYLLSLVYKSDYGSMKAHNSDYVKYISISI